MCGLREGHSKVRDKREFTHFDLSASYPLVSLCGVSLWMERMDIKAGYRKLGIEKVYVE